MTIDIEQLFEDREVQLPSGDFLRLPGVRVTEIRPDGLYRVEFEPMTSPHEPERILYGRCAEITRAACDKHLKRLVRRRAANSALYSPEEIEREEALYLALKSAIETHERLEA